MTHLYEIVVLGDPPGDELNKLREEVRKVIEKYGFKIGREVKWTVNPDKINNPGTRGVAAAYFAFSDKGKKSPALATLVQYGIPVLPIVHDLRHATAFLPDALKSINAAELRNGNMTSIAADLLSSIGLLSKQRRVFLSYRRNEATEAAHQLFEALSRRKFNVFLDTHVINAGDHFQDSLWHHLCDCDVLVMLDTKSYFESRWTEAEFGRALAKDISILRVGWPKVPLSERAQTADQMPLKAGHFAGRGKFTNATIEEICNKVEETRCKSNAIRSLLLVSKLRSAANKVGGKVLSIGTNMAVHIQLPGKRKPLVVYPRLGVPTSAALHDAHDYCSKMDIEVPAVAYDHVGLLPGWQRHLDWLGEHVKPVRWMKVDEAAWRFADWEKRGA